MEELSLEQIKKTRDWEEDVDFERGDASSPGESVRRLLTHLLHICGMFLSQIYSESRLASNLGWILLTKVKQRHRYYVLVPLFLN